MPSLPRGVGGVCGGGGGGGGNNDEDEGNESHLIEDTRVAERQNCASAPAMAGANRVSTPVPHGVEIQLSDPTAAARAGVTPLPVSVPTHSGAEGSSSSSSTAERSQCSRGWPIWTGSP